jgi:hypothetical protein
MDWGIGIGRIVCAGIHGIERTEHHHRAGDGGEAAGREQRCKDPRVGSSVSENETLRTGSAGQTNVQFIDNSALNVGPASVTRVAHSGLLPARKTAAVKIKTPSWRARLSSLVSVHYGQAFRMAVGTVETEFFTKFLLYYGQERLWTLRADRAGRRLGSSLRRRTILAALNTKASEDSDFAHGPNGRRELTSLHCLQVNLMCHLGQLFLRDGSALGFIRYPPPPRFAWRHLPRRCCSQMQVLRLCTV